ncbi:MAG: hypothetical protein K0U86_07570 [Planctomycetes bacterium]|nr:hypothetical protein [Planctomycetota bacterium]MCH9724747.1 hypothetical protein [Planctomycetota bacterium]MCH9778807.1 hypothetical protein [Planctomycetota bacterium]
MSNRSCNLAILISLFCLQAGCQTIPDYHQPAGFSSTYHKRIYPETAMVSLSKSATQHLPEDQGVFYPTDVKVKQPTYHAPLAEIKGRITDEELQDSRRRLQLDSLRRSDNYINREQIYNENFPAPASW